jgi:flagellar motility protein MotE (MotC chaperone)
MGFNPEFYRQEMLKNANLFDENLNKLLASKADIDKAKRDNKDFEQKIKDLNNTWVKFYDSVKKVSKNSKDKDGLKFIAEYNIRLLNDVAYIFTNFIKSYNSTDKLEASMAHIKSMLFTQVGKPRMYINKLVKERLLIKQNIDKKKNQENLNNSIKSMDKLMKALKDGDKELELYGTEDRTILDKLAISQKCKKT